MSDSVMKFKQQRTSERSEHCAYISITNFKLLKTFKVICCCILTMLPVTLPIFTLYIAVKKILITKEDNRSCNAKFCTLMVQAGENPHHYKHYRQWIFFITWMFLLRLYLNEYALDNWIIIIVMKILIFSQWPWQFKQRNEQYEPAYRPHFLL